MNLKHSRLICLSGLLIVLAGCGGGGGGSGASEFIASAGDAAGDTITFSGTVTYTDYSVNLAGIDYDSEQRKPVRGAVIQLLNSAGTELASSNTNSDGSYSLSGSVSGTVRILVRAELGSPGNINTRVVDNTRGQALYTLFAEVNVEGSRVIQNLNAGSGWGGSSYTGTRSAGPFSILDVIYQAQKFVLSVDSSADFPLLTVNWSTLNSSADGNVSDGDIGTSFYQSDNIFLLGNANADTDEYDKGIIAHEWGHYFDDNFSRLDSPGGRRSQGDILHPSLAWAEGFSTALAAMILNNPLYIDTVGFGQSFASVTNVEQDSVSDTATFSGSVTPLLDGYYSENSVMELVYDVFDGGPADDDTIALGFAPIYQVLTGGLRTTKAFTSLFPFLHYIKQQAPANSAGIDALFLNENIDVANANEFDDPSDISLPPMYTEVAAETTVAFDINFYQLQTSDDYGFANITNEGNKLLNQRFFKATAAAAACYTVTAIPVTPTVSADLLLTFSDGLKVDRFFIRPEARDIILSASEVVTFNVGAFSNNAHFNISFISGC
ncbi:MAG: hypothetical protein ACI90U_001229 [Pseudomonadales bacterium]|jgi:hypothetical protein